MNLLFTGVLLLSLGLRSPFASGAWTAPFRFFGHISYGLYLIHVMIFVRYDDHVPDLSNPVLRHILQNAFLRFFLCGGLSVLVAWISRTFYEERFLRMARGPKSAVRSIPSTSVPQELVPITLTAIPDSETA
jgi:peptidoglycan/LPS O-acetylase OafA/YrhL